MPLVLLLGGARSGKSELAVRLASSHDASVVVVATAQALDADMAGRIAEHRCQRPAAWETVEVPLELEQALRAIAPEQTVIVDCLTLWVSNLLIDGLDEGEITTRASAAARQARGRGGLTVVVSNEVGLGVVPDNELGRRYRDALGRVNAAWSAAADHVYLLVAGRMLTLAAVDGLLAELA
jgi:adenosyl cobinamide kinase/adenosyl cobinamide phosphate guanylyltransferase